MQTIWKFPIEITDAQTLQMPDGAKVLTVQMQGGQPCLWAIVKDEAPLTDRVIEIFGTGNPMWVDMGVERRYIATFSKAHSCGTSLNLRFRQLVAGRLRN